MDRYTYRHWLKSLEEDELNEALRTTNRGLTKQGTMKWQEILRERVRRDKGEDAAVEAVSKLFD